MKKAAQFESTYYKVRASGVREECNSVYYMPSPPFPVTVNGTGYVCIVATPSSPGKYKIAMSFKSPTDKLDKPFGIKVALGRLQSKHACKYRFSVNAVSAAMAFDAAIHDMPHKTRTIYVHGKKAKAPLIPNWLSNALAKGRQLKCVER